MNDGWRNTNTCVNSCKHLNLEFIIKEEYLWLFGSNIIMSLLNEIKRRVSESKWLVVNVSSLLQMMQRLLQYQNAGCIQ